MSRKLDGPRLKPRSGRARQLVVFLHGYGADGNDLIELGRNWADLLPDAAFVAPHAPEPCGMSPMGRQWWPLTMRDVTERERGCRAAGPDLDSFLDEELARNGLPPERLALVGFSQGSMMALFVGPRRAIAPAAIVAYSGHLVAAEKLGDEARAKPPILLVHGAQDDVIPVDALFDSMEGLTQAGIPCQWHLSLGVAHGIDPDGLRHGGQFIAQNFGLRLPG